MGKYRGETQGKREREREREREGVKKDDCPSVSIGSKVSYYERCPTMLYKSPVWQGWYLVDQGGLLDRPTADGSNDCHHPWYESSQSPPSVSFRLPTRPCSEPIRPASRPLTNQTENIPSLVNRLCYPLLFLSRQTYSFFDRYTSVWFFFSDR